LRAAGAVPGSTRPPGADPRRLVGHQIGQEPARAAGHGPAERTVTSVEEQVTEGGAAHDGRAIGRSRTQTGPEIGALQIAALRVEVGGDHFQGFATTRVERQIETGDLGHATNADATAETGDGDLVGVVWAGRG